MSNFCRVFGLKWPIIQGPFGGGLSTSALTAAVSNQGALGSFGAHHLGGAAIVDKVRDIRSKTDKPFSINLWVQNGDSRLPDQNDTHLIEEYLKEYDLVSRPRPTNPFHPNPSFEEQIEAVLEIQPPIVSFVFGLPSQSVIEKLKEKHIFTIGAATSVDEAEAVQKSGLDAVVASGFEAGGHRPAFLKEPEDSLMSLSCLLQQLRHQIKIPIIAAGGLATKESILAAKVLGADAFQLGSAFLACDESGASRAHRDALFKKQNTVLSRHYTGRLARFIDNDFLKRHRHQNTTYLPYPWQNQLLSDLKQHAAAECIPSVAAFYASQSIGLFRHRRATDLVNEIASWLDSNH